MGRDRIERPKALSIGELVHALSNGDCPAIARPDQQVPAPVASLAETTDGERSNNKPPNLSTNSELSEDTDVVRQHRERIYSFQMARVVLCNYCFLVKGR